MTRAAIAGTMAVRFDAAQPWRQALSALLLLWFFTLVLYQETGLAMVGIWARSDTFAHAFLVPPISLWLVWRQRQRLAVQTPRPTLAAAGLMAGAAFVWLLGALASVNAVTQLAFVTLLVLAVPAVLGWSVARVIVFPLGFLFFSVPIGEFLMPQLMEWTANFTVVALRISGIPVYREGLQFVIPTGNWSVVEACSGVRYLIASLTVGTLFAYLNYQSNQRRLVFVLISLVVPIVANWMRAYLIVMLGHYSGNKLASGVDHLIYGWLFFGVVMMLMFVIGARWTEPGTGTSARVIKPHAPMQALPVGMLWLTTASIVGLVALPHMALWANERGGAHAPASLTAPATLPGNWGRVDPDGPVFKPAFQNPSAEFNAQYASQEGAVGLYLGYYRHQDFNRKLVSSNNVLVTSKDPQWAQVTHGTRPANLDGQSLEVRTAELRGASLVGQVDGSRLVVWQIYWVNGTLTASDHVAKAYGAFYQLMGRGDDAAVIVVSTPKDHAGGADAVLASFLATNYAAINALLTRTLKSK